MWDTTINQETLFSDAPLLLHIGQHLHVNCCTYALADEKITKSNVFCRPLGRFYTHVFLILVWHFGLFVAIDLVRKLIQVCVNSGEKQNTVSQPTRAYMAMLEASTVVEPFSLVVQQQNSAGEDLFLEQMQTGKSRKWANQHPKSTK